MSEARSIANFIKSLPAATGGKILGADTAGNPVNFNTGNFANVASINILNFQVLKIYVSSSLLVSCRGNNGGRCALTWVSGYGEGTAIRNTVVKLCAGPYRIYNNGKSDKAACIYLISDFVDNNPDHVYIMTLEGSAPRYEIVPSLPADATLA